MAGLALYGDLTTAMSAASNIQIFHQLESVKLINNHDPHDPELYGAVTIEAANTPIVSAPFRPRIYCMAVTDKDQAYYGRPSSWSASLDKITFGNEDENLEKQLFLFLVEMYSLKPQMNIRTKMFLNQYMIPLKHSMQLL